MLLGEDDRVRDVGASGGETAKPLKQGGEKNERIKPKWDVESHSG